MKYLCLFFFIFTISCGYLDIDLVPKFNDLKITKEDSIELCKISNNNNLNIARCIGPYVKDLQNFQSLDINEETYIELCKIINDDTLKLKKCLSAFYETQN